MDAEDNRCSDKIRLSDEDYHDIAIDWSNESFDFRKQLFHQLSAYTGILVIHQEYVSVYNVDDHRCAGIKNAECRNGYGNDYYGWRYDTKERAMRALHDGDCFLLETEMVSDGFYPGIYCMYELVHRDHVSETGCNHRYCHYLGSRPITKKILELINSDYLQKVLDVEGQTVEDRDTIINRMQLNLNIKHFTELKCSAKILFYPRLGLRIHSNYLRYRGIGIILYSMSFMMLFYWRIYIVASRTTRALKRGYKTTKTGDSETDGSSDKRLTLRMHRGYICEDTGSNASSETPSLMSSLSTDVHNCHQLHPIHGHSHAHHHNLQGYNNRVDDNNNSPSEMSNISSVNNNNNFNALNDTNNSHSNISGNAANSGSTNINSCESHFGNNLVVPKFTPGNANAGSGSGSGGGKGRRKTPITVYRSPRLQVNSIALEGSGSCCEADGQKRRSTCSLASSCSGLTSLTGVESSPSHTRDSGRSNASKSVRFSRRANTGKWQTRRLLAETKAAKTVGIIVGGFIICWFPFFTIYLIRGYCRDQNCVPKLLLTIFTWLGYTNSAVNPIIYGLFSRDFRRAFKNIICKCKYSEETGVTSLIRQIHLPNLFEEDNHDDCMKTDSQEDVH
uniref:G-protein coupled receptors family 1 profile domain-containing protein n=1 Tax=Tetranychus urticae TaxID=32264 RepID=T1KL44_TETUR